MIARCGPYRRAPAKTRVAFVADVRFASVNRVTEDAIHVHFVLPRVVASPRLRRVDDLGSLHVHHLRLERPADFDRELQGWLLASYREYGRREWLEPHAPRRLRPVIGAALAARRTHSRRGRRTARPARHR